MVIRWLSLAEGEASQREQQKKWDFVKLIKSTVVKIIAYLVLQAKSENKVKLLRNDNFK